MNISEINFGKCGEGCFTVGSNKEIPFDVKRIYYIFNVKDSKVRGCHAHKELNQVFFMLKGECNMHLDDGIETKTIKMTDNAHALFVGKMVWHEMTDFTDDAVFVALASDEYQESDYIRNYQDFIDNIGDKHK